MAFVSLAASQVDAKSPVDEQLMQQIKDNEDDLDSRLLTTKSVPYHFKLNGRLDVMPESMKRRIDGIFVALATTINSCRLYLEKPGTSGILEVDVRKILRPNTPITAIARLFKQSINSIARAGSSLSTQSVTRSTASITTQSVSVWKATLNISSIVPLGSNLMRYNLVTAPDSDWEIGDSVLFSGCSSGVNNGTFSIVRINDDGANNIVITNASGVAQSGAAGNVELQAFNFTYTNPVSTEFSAGELVTFSGHTNAGNDGTATIYAINQAGNNIIVKAHSNAPTTQAAGGTANVNRWIFAQSASVSSDYAVGEKILAQSHTSGGNNGSFLITAVNQGGNNVIVYNPSGVTQGGAAGTIDTYRWVYFFSTNPSTNITAGDRVVAASTTSAANSGTFTVKQVNRTTNDNVVVYNESGATQGGAAGTLESTKTKLSFSSNQSATYTTESKVEVIGSPGASIDDEAFEVVEVNRGGGSNFNVVIDADTCTEAVGPSGRIIFESKSIFSTRPSLDLPTSTVNSTNRHGQLSTNAVFNANASVSAGDLLGMDITSTPVGPAENVVVSLI